MHNYEDLLAKSKEWRDWYYDGAPTPNPVTESVSDAFDLINATLFGHIYQREALPATSAASAPSPHSSPSTGPTSCPATSPAPSTTAGPKSRSSNSSPRCSSTAATPHASTP